MRRKSANPLTHLLQRKVVEPLETYPVRESRELLMIFGQPKPFVRCITQNYGNQLRVGQQSQNIINQCGQVKMNGD